MAAPPTTGDSGVSAHPDGYDFVHIGKQTRKTGPRPNRRRGAIVDIFPPPNVRLYLKRFKEEFVRRKEKNSRLHFLRTVILPQTFNHWMGEGKVFATIEDLQKTSSQVASWINRNWRVEGKVYDREIKLLPRRVTALDIARERHSKDIELEIASLNDKEKTEIGPGHPGYVGIRSRAAGIVLQSLPEDTREEYRELARIKGLEPLPEEKQQQLALSEGYKRVKTFHQHVNQVTGMQLWTMSAYKNSHGVWNIRVNDHITSHMSVVGALSFKDKYPTLVNNVKRRMFDYVKSLEEAKDMESVPEHRLAKDTGSALKIVSVKPHLIPLLPEPGSGVHPEALVKRDLAASVRTFMTLHWVAAHGGKKQSVPWTAIIRKGFNMFIDPVHLPSAVQMADPHNMAANDLMRMLLYWQDRQEHLGAKMAFRWSHILSGEELIEPQYGVQPGSHGTETGPDGSAIEDGTCGSDREHVERPKKGRGKKKNNEGQEEDMPSGPAVGPDAHNADIAGKGKKSAAGKKNKTKVTTEKRPRPVGSDDEERGHGPLPGPPIRQAQLTMDDLERLDPALLEATEVHRWSNGPLPSLTPNDYQAGFTIIDLGLANLAREHGFNCPAANGPDDGEILFYITVPAYKEILASCSNPLPGPVREPPSSTGPTFPCPPRPRPSQRELTNSDYEYSAYENKPRAQSRAPMTTTELNRRGTEKRSAKAPDRLTL